MTHNTPLSHSETPTFLELVASRLMDLLHGDLSNTVVIFPNKRASLFFNISLAKLAGHTIWSPRYMTIDELFTSLSTYDIADPIYAVCLLYKSYIRQTGRDESLDKFYGWGEMMISDFDDIDKNMVDARLLFENIRDLDELTTLDYLTDEQKKAILRFFGEFKEEVDDETGLKKEFMTLWKNMNNIYTDFRNALLQEQKAYTGMLYRWVVETISSSPEDNPCLERLRSTNYVFVGFNVLTKTEERLLKYIQQHKNTYFFWDYDEAYMPGKGFVDNGQTAKPEENDLFEAGKYIYRNIKKFGNDLTSSNTLTNLHNKKNIRFISSSTEDMQARYATNWVNQLYEEKLDAIITSGKEKQEVDEAISDIDFTRTAIVLCNESSLQSVMDSMPSTIGDTDYPLPVNITMGYPLNQTPVSSLIEALLNLQVNGYAGGSTWKFKYVSVLLNHPYMLMMSGEHINEVMRYLQNHNIMYPSTEMLHQKDSFLAIVFTPQLDSVPHLINYLIEIVRTIAITYNKLNDKRFSQYQLGVESLFNTHTILTRLQGLHATGLLDVNVNTICRLIRQLLAITSIPFHGEPAEGVQVMGMLETRCLDFSNIILLSATEDMLPKARKNSSFIPFNLRQAYGMTTFDQDVSLYAYYFFRLLQRANHITLLYNNSTDGLSKGEMSRFLLQMLVDKDILFAPDQKIEQYNLSSDITISYPKDLCIPKTDSMLQTLRNKFESWRHKDDDKGYFSPTAINTYLECKMKFFFKYVAGIYPEDEVTEDVDNASFGSIFHKTMESIYKSYLGRGDIQDTELESIAKDSNKIRRYVNDAFKEVFFKGMDVKYNGEQLLNREVICTYVANQLLHDKKLCPMRILGVEKKCRTELEIEVKGEQPVKLFVGGIIDRFDDVTIEGQRYTRIVDYKTSSSLCKYAGLEALFTPGEDKKNAHHIRQAFYYADVVMEEDKDLKKLYPTLMYVKLSNQCPPTIEINDKNQSETKVEFSAIKDEYHNYLMETLKEVFNKEVPFTQCQESGTCDYCDFKELCNRDKEKKD